ncbi:hypothetical protein PILCRDRAFT_3352 [Piloderma croceum F 1598]|uniref:Uncharacterized protein n=1 Tax=Piloderma croceum (strain F 1598) TaxID=765440 RepID=A0A0C3GCH4_PILCF|nr:hypothetical protein PILCRDRAFT_3352 [Piloderma croceum F 1598]
MAKGSSVPSPPALSSYNQKDKGILQDINASDLALWKMKEPESIRLSKGLTECIHLKGTNILLFAEELEEMVDKVLNFFPNKPP